jgi:hypothetical protein
MTGFPTEPRGQRPQLHIAIFYRYPSDEIPLFCGPEAMQPHGKVDIEGGTVEDAWFTTLPNISAVLALLDSIPEPIIIHRGRGRGGDYRRLVYVLEIVNEEPK